MGLFDKLKKSLFGKNEEDEIKNISEVQKETTEAEKEDSSDNSNVNSIDSDKSDNDSEASPKDTDGSINDEVLQKDIVRSDVNDVSSEDSESSESEASNISVVEEDSFEDSKEPNDDKVDSIEPEQDQSDNEEKYQYGLKKSRNSFAAGFNRFLAKFRTVDNEFFDNLEDFLIESDVGYELTMDLTDQLKEMVKEENLKSKEQIGESIIQYLVDSYGVDDTAKTLEHHEGLNIYLFVGVNGAGKTTTIGKLANRLIKDGKKVILVAGDTFRAGATEQLDGWAKKTGAKIVKGKTDQDPASLVYEGIHQAQEEEADYLLIDTAGRLQNKVNLMNELDKIKRTIEKEAGTNPTETLLVIDSTTGQNGLNQAKEFNQVTKLSGLVLSKLDGTAKGGIVLQIKKSLDIPVKLVGLGEQVDDLVDFDSAEFMRGFFSGILQV